MSDSVQEPVLGIPHETAADDTRRTVIETMRLVLRPFTDADAAFVVELLTDAAFVRFVGDRGVHSMSDAHAYLQRPPAVAAPLDASLGSGSVQMFAVTERGGATPVGMCGLLRRPTLTDVDIGFAFLPRARGHGYAREAAHATLEYARTTLRLRRVVAIVAMDNSASRAVLEHLQMHEVGEMTDLATGVPLLQYAIDFADPRHT